MCGALPQYLQYSITQISGSSATWPTPVLITVSCILVYAEVRERLAVNKQISHTFHMERLNLKKLNEIEGREQFIVEVSNSLQLWKILMQRWKLIVPGKRLERI
jgi:hypothetical protein